MPSCTGPQPPPCPHAPAFPSLHISPQHSTATTANTPLRPSSPALSSHKPTEEGQGEGRGGEGVRVTGVFTPARNNTDLATSILAAVLLFAAWAERARREGSAGAELEQAGPALDPRTAGKNPWHAARAGLESHRSLDRSRRGKDRLGRRKGTSRAGEKTYKTGERHR